MPSQRIAVIGGVASGPAAAAEARRTDPEADVVLFEQGPHISYGACEMPYYVAGDIDDADTLVILTPEAFRESRGAEVRVRHRVQAIHPERGLLEVEDLETGTTTEASFDKFILAVGARARRPEVEGINAPNVFPMRRLEDAIGIKQYLAAHDVAHAVIVGGGYIGVEMAEALWKRGVRVTILEPEGGLLNRYLDDELRPLVHEEVERHGVQIRAEPLAALALDADGSVRAVRVESDAEIACQLVLLTMGVTPNTELAEAAGLEVGASGALAVNARMETNRPNVWACGDCVEVKRVIDGKKIHLALSPVAFRTAHVAAKNAARRDGEAPVEFPGVCVASAVKVFDLQVAAVGLRLGEARGAGFDAFATALRHWSRVRFYPGARPLHVRYVVERGSGRLLGAELVGEEGAAQRANVLVPLIREGWSVQAVRDLDLVYAPPFAPSMDPLLVAANQAWKEARSDE